MTQYESDKELTVNKGEENNRPAYKPSQASWIALPGNAWTYHSHFLPLCSVSALSGILPGILSLLYEASRAIEGAKTREKFLATVKEKPASYTAMAFSSFLPHSMQPPSPSLNHRKVSRWAGCSVFSNILNFYAALYCAAVYCNVFFNATLYWIAFLLTLRPVDGCIVVNFATM